MKPTQDQINAAYMAGENRAVEEDAGMGTPGPFANPYDAYYDPELASSFDTGYNNARYNLKKTQADEGSWYDPDDITDWD